MDIDETVIKIKITGDLKKWEHWEDDWTFTTSGLYIRDNPTCSNENQWVIIKVVKKMKPKEGISQETINERFTEVAYYAYSVKKAAKSFDINKVMKYCGLGDENYIVCFEKSIFREDVELKEKRGILYSFNRFKHLMDNLHCIYAELSSGNH